MIELQDNVLKFRFPEVHPDAGCNIDFQRTLRIPDDNHEYPLPPGLGHFPIEHVDDFTDNLPKAWQRHGGVFVPMYQSEALWLNFTGRYPCAIKIAAGKINAVSGEAWSKKLTRAPQDYVVIPEQPWLDGFNVAEGYIRQFVAMPLGEGFTAEEQITGESAFGGLQIIAYPMKAERYKEYLDQFDEPYKYDDAKFCLSAVVCESAEPDMGLAPGGLMRQEIYDDEYGLDAWDQGHGLRCFIHLANSEMYEDITGHNPPHRPPTAKDYTNAGLPWFDYYADKKTLPGSDVLGTLSSVGSMMVKKGKGLLNDNDPVQPKVIKSLGKKNIVRDGEF